MSYINRNRYIESEGRCRIGVEGYYSGRAIKNGKVMREFGCTVPVPNLITNLGMNALGGTPAFTRMHLGTGTAAPAFTDVALGTFGVNVLNGLPTLVGANSGSSPYFGTTTMTWTSAVGGATGNWTEIGISNQNTTGNLRSRALILDGVGSPTVFPVLADEQFQGVYTLRTYVPLVDDTESITLSGTPYDTTTRALRATAQQWAPLLTGSGSPFRDGSPNGNVPIMYTGALAVITATNPAGSILTANGTSSVSAYVSDSFQLDSAYRWGSAQGVGVGRTLMLTLMAGFFQVEYSPTINKLTTQELIHNQRVIWARR